MNDFTFSKIAFLQYQEWQKEDRLIHFSRFSFHTI